MWVECVGLGWRGLDQQWVLPQAITLNGNPSRNLLYFSSPFLHLPHCSGDIEAFKGMELTSLELYNCNKLTGVFGLGWGLVGGVKIGNRLRPQAITHDLHGC